MFSSFNSFLELSILPLAILFLIFGVDDLIISFLLWWHDLKPSRLSREESLYIQEIPEKSIAILVASWKEAGVLGKMVRGNLNLIQYSRFDFYLGVYPNDPDTLEEAVALQNELPNVFVVINTKSGPTTKGQLLNELVQFVIESERTSGTKYEGFLIHDSEDLISAHSLKIVNWLLNHYDFIQLPVFPISISCRNLVAGTYLDEFAETHTRDLLVRSFLGLSIPSAGVGTALSRSLVQLYREKNGGNLLNPVTVTEDYELGVSTANYRLKSIFACYYFKSHSAGPHGRSEFIATREYFPKTWTRSVRQKTRWILGIAFQSWTRVRWSGSISHCYFLYRDRKGPLCNLLGACGLFLLIASSIQILQSHIARNTFFNESKFKGSEILATILTINLIIFIHRIYVRSKSVYLIYGFRSALFSPLRLPISTLINATAAAFAIYEYTKSLLSKRSIEWIKTEHELPEGFGHDVKTQNQNASNLN